MSNTREVSATAGWCGCATTVVGAASVAVVAASVAVGKTWAMVGVAAIRVLINNVCLFVITFSLGRFFLFILFFLWCKSSEKLWGAQSSFVRIFIVKMLAFCYEGHIFSSVFSVSIKKWHKCLVVILEKDIFATCYM